MKSKIGQIIAAVLPVLAVGIIGFVLFHSSITASVKVQTSPPPEHNYNQSSKHHWLNGVAISRDSDLPEWIAETGEHPDIVALYTRLNQPFPFYETRLISREGALPLLQVNPRFTSLKDIIEGKFDGHIRSWSASLHKLEIPVAISFAHEMNGTWDTWGCGNTPARQFVRAWRHMHDLIGTHNVIWVWNTNKIWNGSCRMKARYPDKEYVDWIGIDGYLREPESTFSSVFRKTIRQIRKFAPGVPIFLAETGVPAGPNQARQIHNLYAGARRAGLFGLIYFDSATRKGNYRPQDNPEALKAFLREINLGHRTG